MKKKNIFLKLTIIFFGTIIGLLLLIVVVGNSLKAIMFNEYFRANDTLCVNPGLSDRFVPQGVCVSEENDLVFTCGYMMDKTKPSRIYIVEKRNEVRFVQLYKNDKPFTSHCGGMATTADKIYIATGKKIYVLNLSDVINNSKVDVGEGIKINNNASFVFTDESYLYVGEFNDGGKYVTNHPNKTNDGTYNAILTKYSLSDLTTPVSVYAIRDRVQGFCVTDNNEFVLCTSYGLTNTVYYVYDSNKLSQQGLYDNAPLYYLDNYSYKFEGPQMGEDLDFSNGKVITLSEIACDKYIIGKFLFETYIDTIDLDKIKK